MKLKTQAIGALLATLAFTGLGTTASAADRPFTEGSVFEVTSIRTEPGMFDDYMAWLAGPWRKLMDEQKKAGIILSYEVDIAMPRGPNDADLYLITEYKNLGAMDNLEDKMDAISERLMGSQQKQNADAVARGKMRTVLGSELVRKVNFK